MKHAVGSIFSIFIFFNASSAPADDALKPDLRPGVAASTQRFTGSGAVDTSDDPIAGMLGGSAAATANPVTGGVARVRGDRCRTTLQNHSEDAFSIRYVIVSENRGKEVRRTSHSASLPPGKSVENLFICDKRLNTKLIITSGKRRVVRKPNAPKPSPVADASTAEPREKKLEPFEPF